ncbi:MAG TPA: protease pro-enzyme activation domain-containing protein [Acidobacteriaceae bacterium]|jgi:subtilase family serine protease|nr:protease pro-enzyme activation domain-containing protein [Acidobacteriaceae bacterium]
MSRFSRLLLAVLLVPVPLIAQQPRIAEAIDPNAVATLRDSVSPRLARAVNLGPLDPATPINGITLYFQPSATQKAKLDALVQAQQTAGSALYHAWLTPATYAARFGLSDADLAKVESWLNSQGFNIDRVANSHNSITVSGTAALVEAAFGTQLNRYQLDGESHFANASDLQIPAALSGILQSVRNLNDFRPRPEILRTSIRRQFTAKNSGPHYLTPKDVATIYDINAAYNSGYTGSGQTLVVVGQSEISKSDIEAFQTAAGLTVKDPNQILVPSSGTATVVSGDEAESDLDIEYAGGTARGATIDFVYTGNNSNYDVYDSLQYAVDNKLGNVISMSYGTCETELDASSFASLDTVVEQGASQGQSILAAAGDTGSTACYDPGGSSGLTTAQQEALSVNYPASSAYATGIGGTEFPSADVAASNTTYWDSSSSSDVISSALSYIPEQVWNDDSAAIGSQYGAQYALSAGGGGTSAFAARPSWQKGVTGIASGSYRLVPDVSLDASADNAGYLYCTSDSSSWSSGQKASCNSGFRDSSTQDLTIGGGTSFATPIFAGLLAIVNQKENASGLGLVNPTLYTLAANATTYAAAFHDITSGSNKCTAGTTYCSTAGDGSYAATTGYDEASGLGSVDFENLLNAWPAGTGSSLDGSVTTVSAATTTPASGASDVITITVSPSLSSITAVPTGTVTITVDGTVQTPTLTLAAGVGTYSFSSTTAGSHVILANYSGDATFAASSGSATVTVAGGTSSGTFTLSAANVSVTQGNSGTSAVALTSQNSYAGTVSFALSTTNASLQQYGCYTIANATLAAGGTATSTLTLYTSLSACNALTGSKSGAIHSFIRRGGTIAGSQHRQPLGPGIPLGAAAFAGLLFIGFRRVRRHAWTLMSCLLLVVVLGFSTGCGGGSGSSTSGSSTSSTSTDVAKGTYTVTLAGTDTVSSSITASTNLALTVN